MNKIIRISTITLVLTAGLFIFGCDVDSGDLADPQVRFTNAGTTYVWACLGTFDNKNTADTSDDTFEAISAWLNATSGNTTGYVSLSPGTYRIIGDADADHSEAGVYSLDRVLGLGKKYTIVLEEVSGTETSYFITD